MEQTKHVDNKTNTGNEDTSADSNVDDENNHAGQINARSTTY